MKHPVDAHVGKRVRHRRWMMGMTQQQLGDLVGIKFQQIQKYETGMNRISASRLWDIAKSLEVPISYFFEGLDAESIEEVESRIEVAGLPEPTLIVSSGRGFHAYWRLAEPLEDLAEWSRRQVAIATMIGADELKDAPRVLRPRHFPRLE